MKGLGMGLGSGSRRGSQVPVGMIIAYGGSSPPDGWLECDGSAVSRTTYAALFAAIGTTWGTGDGSTTFHLPDLRRRVLMGAGGTRVSGPANTLGSTGGSETHTLTTGEMPSHTHGFGGTIAVTPGTGLTLSSGSNWSGITATAPAGSGDAHNNVQPSAVVHYLIRY